jgi:TonB-dependent starch-binding outer membrane protein SusC
MKKIACLLLLFCFAYPASFFAQTTGTITVKGVVTSFDNGTPLGNATIVVKGESKGVTTDSVGKFSIKVPKGKAIEVSYVGFEKQEITVSKSQTILVILKSTASTAADEVIVIGYGTQKKSSVTGAVAKYKNDKIDETSVARLDQALQGRIAGVQVQNINPEAGADPKITIRGTTSLNASTQPLVVVDGQPIPDGLAFVNMADVESVEVLKDAASAAIYGSRGSAGVIMVTTKSGKAEKTKYSFKYSVGIKNPYKLYDIMSVSEYTRMLFDEATLRYKDSAAYTLGFSAANLASFSTNRGNLITTAERAAYVIENTITGATDWQNEALRTGLNKNIQLSATGGSKTVKYFVSGGYQKDEGMMYHSNYEKFNVRTKLDVQLSKKAKLSMNLNPSYSKRERPSVNFTDFYRFLSYLPIYHSDSSASFVRQSPTWPNIKAGDFAQARHFNGRVYSGLMPDGSIWNSAAAQDPFATANNTPKSIMETRSINGNEYRMQASMDFTYNLLPGLDFKTQASGYINYATTLDFAKRNSTQDGVVAQGIYTNRTNTSLYSENTFTYNKKIKQHSINVLAGFTSEQNTFKDEKVMGLDYPNDNITSLNTALQVNKDSSYNRFFKEGLLSYLGRINYSYANKYLLSVSMRYDGSSKFAPRNKWGSFPAISGGWVVSEEKFLNGKVDWLNKLKLRASYGLTGNNRIADYGFVDLLYAGNYPFGGGTGTASTGQISAANLLANPNITWERTRQANFGIDITAFKNRLTLAVDVYRSTTEKLLIQQSAMAFTGASFYNNNNGSFRNNGIEIEMSTVNINKRDFKWNTSLNISRNRNNVIELGKEAFLLNQGERTELYLNQAGNPLIQYFGFKTDGVWLSQADIDAARAKGLTSALTNVFVPGGLKLVDLNGDNVIDNNDRTVIGNPYPDFTWGLTNSLNYKNFDFSFTFQGVQGGTLINGDVNYNESKRYNKIYNENRWISPNNPGDGRTPYSTVGFNWMLTDYCVEDASYYALREVLLGYKFNPKIAKKIGLSNLRVYASAQNLLFHFPKGYRSLNPEARTNSAAYASPLIDGYQRGAFPTSRSFVFGIDINF